MVSPDLYKEYRTEVFLENSGGKTRAPVEHKLQFKRRARNKTPKVETTTAPSLLDGFQTIDSLDPKHYMRAYVESRKIPVSTYKSLYWTKDMRTIADAVGGYSDTHFDKFPRLLLPFIDQTGKITHIQGRAVGDNVPKKSRYYTLTVDDDAPKVFGMDKTVGASSSTVSV